MKKILFTILTVLLVVIVGGGTYIKMYLPHVNPAPDITIDVTPERVKNGEYLANHVAVCMDCHSTRDWSKYSGPIVPGTLGKGGEYFNEKMGLPGEFYSRNITPDHLSSWTDGEIYKAVTTGVSRNGYVIFPVMPYSYYGRMATEDVYDIIAYLRTLAPIKNQTPEHKVDFPMSFILNTIPHNASPEERPAKSDTLKYGGYIIGVAGCAECHTPVEHGQIIPEKMYTGGREFTMPNGILRTANLTPDVATGIGTLSADDFIAKFKAFSDKNNLPVLKPNEVNTIMPWTLYSGMDTTDLLAIYKYLRTLKPVNNRVIHFESIPKKG
jgi:mono/diheme cytochrome c family protein